MDGKGDTSEKLGEYTAIRLAVEKRQCLPANFVPLYKGATMSRINAYLSTQQSRHLQPTALVSNPPTNFSSGHGTVYFAYSRTVANYYARMARRISKNPNERVGILCIYMP